MVRTFLEQKYEGAVIRYISSLGLSKSETNHKIAQFSIHSQAYYCGLCDALYAVSTGQNMKPIWLKNTGECYLSLYSQGIGDRILAFPDEIPPFTLDLVDQLEFAIYKI